LFVLSISYINVNLNNFEISGGDVSPTQTIELCISESQAKVLVTLISKSINEVQLLILRSVKDNVDLTISSLLNMLSEQENIPLSTLKFNAKLLKELNLINYRRGCRVVLTDEGKFILNLLDGEVYEQG
jgi:hypothetical protein